MDKYRILVADDDPDASYNLTAILEHEGYEVITAYDGRRALELVKDKKPNLIFLDIMMPFYNGYEVCEKIKSDPATADIPVIMLTARDMGEDVEEALKKQADWYITKPYDYKYIVSKVKQFLPKK
ncbi:MAG: response regulator [Endomicrobiales bacterium]|nr:response regulator [Endomicrobiales bacterium]